MRLLLLNLLVLLATAAQAAGPGRQDYPPEVKPIIEQRCMVCHGCYDAPCQLKMDDWIGLNRGASKKKVYDGTRLLPANLTRLYEDALSDEEWREKGFYPVLQRDDITQSVLYKMLALKEKYPLPTEGPLPGHFDFSLDRKQSCPKPKQFGLYNQNRPEQGMPYGFPGVDPRRMETLAGWLNRGAPGVDVTPRPTAELERIERWEAFFNGTSLKQQLMSRYIYEHLFIGNLFFEEQDDSGWYKLVRSRTPSGQPIDIIATRRPFDDPGAEHFYYRLQLRHTSILDKRHMPYALNAARMQRWQELFLDRDYKVSALPGYENEVAANPFISFEQLPVDTRYKFMLDEAHFTIMGFIKGPVCRGQVALNVIDDHFWVAFARPNNLDPDQQADFLREVSTDLRIPRPKGSLIITLLEWRKYAARQKEYLHKEAVRTAEILDDGVLDIDLDLLWDGGGSNNPNASLTVFRHGDSATVVKGLVGQQPKTMWVIDYSLLERIHYLLVAGFDVYGNVGHQLESRLYMDFLRMEGEQNFLQFLPLDQRIELRNHWYRQAGDDVRDFVMAEQDAQYRRETSVRYRTARPKQELMERVRDHIPSAGRHGYGTDEPLLQQLMQTRGAFFSHMPEVAFLQVLERDGSRRHFSLVLNRAHYNNAQMFAEHKRLVPTEDTLTVVEGFIGSYPNMFFQVTRSQLKEFTAAITSMNRSQDYTSLVERYGVRRTAPWFWKTSDEFYANHKRSKPVEAGLFDLNRYQNR